MEATGERPQAAEVGGQDADASTGALPAVTPLDDRPPGVHEDRGARPRRLIGAGRDASSPQGRPQEAWNKIGRGGLGSIANPLPEGVRDVRARTPSAGIDVQERQRLVVERRVEPRHRSAHRNCD